MAAFTITKFQEMARQRKNKLCPVESVNVLGQVFKVIVTADLSDEELGRCETSHQKILLNERQGIDSLKDTLLHEVNHAIANLVGFPPSEPAPPEEDYIARMTTGLRCVMLLNQDLRDWVFS